MLNAMDEFFKIMRPIDNILAGGGVQAGDNITYEGSGPHAPLYNNELPEGRALNRTVTVTLEYEQAQ